MTLRSSSNLEVGKGTLRYGDILKTVVFVFSLLKTRHTSIIDIR